MYRSFKEKSCSSFRIYPIPRRLLWPGGGYSTLGSNSIIAGREHGDRRDVGVCMSGSSNLAEYSIGVFAGAGTDITDASDEDCCETESATSDYAGDLVLF